MRLVSETFGATMLAGVHIDTYHMLSGEGIEERELEWHAENGEPDGYDDYDWHYDHSAIVRDFAQVSAWALTDLLGTDVLKSVEVTDCGSPREYNFTSDWYEARFTVDMDALDAWLAGIGWDLDTYVSEHHESRSGFYSYIPNRLRNPDQRDWTIFFLKLDAYVREELDQEHYNQALWEQEDEVYMDHTTHTLRELEEV